jgi:hypothetical protein
MPERGEIEDREPHVAEGAPATRRHAVERAHVVRAAVDEGAQRRVEVEASTSVTSPIADESTHGVCLIRTASVVSMRSPRAAGERSPRARDRCTFMLRKT